MFKSYRKLDCSYQSKSYHQMALQNLYLTSHTLQECYFIIELLLLHHNITLSYIQSVTPLVASHNSYETRGSNRKPQRTSRHLPLPSNGMNFTPRGVIIEQQNNQHWSNSKETHYRYYCKIFDIICLIFFFKTVEHEIKVQRQRVNKSTLIR